MVLGFDFFRKDLEINKKILVEELDRIRNDYEDWKHSFEKELDSFKSLNKEDQIDFLITTWFSPERFPKCPTVLSQGNIVDDPYFFFCTDGDSLVYQSNFDINIKRGNKKIVRFTDARARHLRFKAWSWDNKFDITIEKWLLKKVSPRLGQNDGLDVNSPSGVDVFTPGREIPIIRKKESSGIGDIAKLMKKEQDEVMGAPIEWTTLIKGVAWSGKTNILLHRIQYLLWEHPNKFSQENILFLCYNVGLKKYIYTMLKNNFPKVNAQTIDKWQKDMFKKYAWVPYDLEKGNDISRTKIEKIFQSFLWNIDDIGKYLICSISSKVRIKSENFLLSFLRWRVERGSDVTILVKINILKILQVLFPNVKKYDKSHMYIGLYILSITEIKQKEGNNSVIIRMWDKEFEYSYPKSYAIMRYILDKPKYDHIFIDEVQDLTNIQIKIFDGFHKNSMTLAGDETQLLSWNQIQKLEESIGISINRKFFLWTSHRNSLQTAIFANEVLKDATVKSEIQKIGFSGLKPIIKYCKNSAVLLEYLQEKIKDLVKNEPSASICVALPKNDLLSVVEKKLKLKGVDCYIARWHEWDFLKKVHITNYHQAKWLEFDYMFILGINNFLSWASTPNKENVVYTLVTRAIKRVYIPFIWDLPSLFKKINKGTYILQ